jgi:hypothetical protein
MLNFLEIACEALENGGYLSSKYKGTIGVSQDWQ